MNSETLINGIAFNLLKDYQIQHYNIPDDQIDKVKFSEPLFEYDEQQFTFFIYYSKINEIPLMTGSCLEKRNFERVLFKSLEAAFKTLNKTLCIIRIGKMRSDLNFDCRIAIWKADYPSYCRISG